MVTKLILNTRNDVVLERILLAGIVMKGELLEIIFELNLIDEEEITIKEIQVEISTEEYDFTGIFGMM